MQYVISTQKTISCFVVSITNFLLVRLLILFSAFFYLELSCSVCPWFFLCLLIGPDLSADQFIENQKSSILFESISLGIIAFKAYLTTLLLSVSGNTKWVFVWWFSLFFHADSSFMLNIYDLVEVFIEFWVMLFHATQSHLIPVTVPIAIALNSLQKCQ